MSRAGSDRSVDVRLAKTLSHPLRQRLLVAYSEREASPKELAERLEAKLGDVSYHTRQLLEHGYIEPVGTRRRRGATQHYYRATSRFVLDDSAWSSLPPTRRRSVPALILADLRRDLLASARPFARDDAHLSRTVVELDEAGWVELSARLRELVDEALRLEATAAGRPGRRIPAELGLALFERGR